MAGRNPEKRLWKTMDFPTLLQLLKPVEADWSELAYHLIDEHEVKAIKAQCHLSNANDEALVKAIQKWLGRTLRKDRKWRTLHTVAVKWGDNTMSQFLKDNNLSEDDEPAVIDVMKWAKESPLRVNWYEMAVELVSKNEADTILANHTGGGNKQCLRMLLNKWWNRTTAADRHWQAIYDVLLKIEQIPVADNILDKCSTP